MEARDAREWGFAEPYRVAEGETFADSSVLTIIAGGLGASRSLQGRAGLLDDGVTRGRGGGGDWFACRWKKGRGSDM